jgi:hypothetical protein
VKEWIGSWRRLREERVAGNSGHCVWWVSGWVGGEGSERDERVGGEIWWRNIKLRKGVFR